MARRTAEITITDEGRDKGKVFLITEMPARTAEKWANRVLIALGKGAGPAIAREIDENAGWAGLVAVGMSTLGALQWEGVAEPLLDEMLACVDIYPTPGNKSVKRPLFTGSDDVEEVRTFITLRKAVLELHMGFPLADLLSKLGRALPTPAASPST
jgi:hypothetical protein